MKRRRLTTLTVHLVSPLLTGLYIAVLTREAPIPALPARPTAIMAELATKASVRNPQAREGRTANLNRSSNLEAYLGQLTGTINTVPCSHCEKEAGPWVLCISVEGFFYGSCANCHYNNEGVRCSFSRFSSPNSILYGY